MNTPTQSPDRMTAQELREQFAQMAANQGIVLAEIESLRAELEALRSGLTQAASKPATTTAADMTEIMTATRITRTRTAGKWYYKMQGGRYIKRGVTVWDEVLKLLDLDPQQIQWDEQDGYTFPAPLKVTILLKSYTDEDSGEQKTTPQKIIGKA